jgi:peptide/nickel transport system substrate-binding protein
MNRKSFVLASLLIVVALVLAACRATAEPTATKAPVEATKAPEPTATEAPAVSETANTLVVAENEHPFTFDPMITWSEITRIAVIAYDALVQWKPGTNELIPWLATEWEISDDGLAYTFKLREGVKFHDGTDLTASDVKFTIDRILDINEGIAYRLEAVESVEAVDDYTVVINLTTPTGPFLEYLTQVWIISEDGVKANATGDDPWASNYLIDNDLGSGPYMLTKSILEQESVFEKFDDYWQGWEGKHVDRIIWLYVKEPATQRLMLESGEIDIAQDPSADDLAAFESNPDTQLLAAPSTDGLNLWFRTFREPLDDVRVRKALVMAFDCEPFLEVAYAGLGTCSNVGPYGSTFPWYNDELEPVPFDLEGAKALLAEAGYPDGGFTLKFYYQCVHGDEVRFQELWGANLAQLGVTLDPVCTDYMGVVDMTKDETSDLDVTISMRFPGQAVDAGAVLRPQFHSELVGITEDNMAWLRDPEVDALFERGDASSDPAEREKIYKDVQELVHNAYPAIFGPEKSYIIAARNWVKGYKFVERHYQSLWIYDMWLDGKP